MSKRTVIKSDEELVIKGKLIVEGNVTQIETTQIVNNLESNSLVINSDGEDVTAELTLNSNGTTATISFSDTAGEIGINVPINLGSYPLTTTGNVTGAYFHGNARTANGIITGQITETANLWFTTARVRGNISVSDTGGDGSLVYDTANGIIIYTGPNQNEANARIDAAPANVRAHLSATDGVSYNSSTGVFTLSSSTAGAGLTYTSGVLDIVAGSGITVNPNNVAVDSTVVRTSGDQSIAGNKTFTGTTYVTGNIEPTAANTYNLGTWANHFDYVFANVLHAERLDLGDANISDIHNSFYVGLASSASVTRTGYGLTYTHNATGGYYQVNAGDGLQISGNNVAVNSTVIRTTGDQSITGNISLTGNLAITGNLDVTANINSLNVVDLNVQDTQIILNANAAAGANSVVKVNRGSSGSDTYIKWDESVDKWKFTNDGTIEYSVPVSTTDLAEGSNLYYTTARANSAMDNYLIGGDGVTYSSGNISVGAGDGITVNADNVAVNATVVRTSGNQSISGVKTFTGELSIPTTAPLSDNTIFIVGTAVYANVSGNVLQLTADSDIGQVEDVGATGLNIYAGYRSVAVGNSMVFYHGIKSINAGSYLDISEASNVISIAGNALGIRGLVSATGNINYNSTTGVISESLTTTDIDEGNNLYFTAARARGNISGTGLISYDSANGIISTTADNYSSWSVETGSGAGAKTAISSGHTLTLSGGSGIAVTNSGNTVTIAMTETGDISAVTAGDGLTGGGASGDVTLNVVAGAGITVNTDNVAVNASYIKGLVSVTDSGGDGSLSYDNSTGIITYTGPNQSEANARMDAYLVGGNGLTYTTGTFAVGAGTGITVNTDNVAVNMSAFSTTNLSEGNNLYFTAARVRSNISVTDSGGDGSLSYDNSSGVITYTGPSQAEANARMDAYLVGGSGLTYSGGTFNVGAGSYITVGANDVSVDATSTNTASKVVARDASGNFAANVITATATSAQYADLAENYLGDADYLPGTVLVFGGDAEVTATGVYESTRVAGVVTTQPAHVMNSHLVGPTVACIALRGRVPVKVTGIVRKGDVLVTAGEGLIGYAVAALDPRSVPAAAIVGKAITDKFETGPGVVEALI